MPTDTSAFRVGPNPFDNVMQQENVSHDWFAGYDATEGLRTPYVTVMEVYYLSYIYIYTIEYVECILLSFDMSLIIVCCQLLRHLPWQCDEVRERR